MNLENVGANLDGKVHYVINVFHIGTVFMVIVMNQENVVASMDTLVKPAARNQKLKEK